MIPHRILPLALMLGLIAGTSTATLAFDHFGHMTVAGVAYQNLTPQARQRVGDLIKLNPKYADWLSWIPAGVTPDQTNMMVFMLAATWPDEIKGDHAYSNDGSAGGDRPEGSPNPTANDGYGDLLRHKYWHFIDTPFSSDGTPLPPIPTPNAQERIALFRGVLASGSPDALKSYDLVWLLHLVGDVHQPLHCATRVSAINPEGDNGGNRVKLICSGSGCPDNLHAFWDDVLGTGSSAQAVLKPAAKAARKLPAPDPVLAAKTDEKIWIAESFQAAQSAVYQAPVAAGDGPFTLGAKYKKAAKKLIKARVALAGMRLANLINHELN